MRAAAFVSQFAVERFVELVARGASFAVARARLERLADTCILLKQRTMRGDRRWLTANGEVILITRDDPEGAILTTVVPVYGSLEPEKAPPSVPRDWASAAVERRAAVEALARAGIKADRLLTRQNMEDVKSLAKKVDYHVLTRRPDVAAHAEALAALLTFAKALGVVDYIEAVLTRERAHIAARGKVPT